MPFPYIRQALTPSEFAAYVAGYDFGPVPPDFIVLHHTAKPDASWTPTGPAREFWDADPLGTSPEQVRAARLSRLDGLQRYYQYGLGWDAGPHLFIDDRFIYLMTPMNSVGIHAKWGNAFIRRGRVHYSVGIEVIGNYSRVPWPQPVQATVRSAVQTLCRHLPIEPVYMYADGVKPGRAVNAKGVEYCPHPERLRYGGISSHRDYNKPECPGNAITEAFYMSVIRHGLDTAAKPDNIIDGANDSQPRHRLTVQHIAIVRQSPTLSGVEVHRHAPQTLLFADALVRGATARDGSNRWWHLSDGSGFVHSSGVTKEQ